MSEMQKKLEEALLKLTSEKLKLIKQIWEIEAREEQIKEKLKIYEK